MDDLWDRLKTLEGRTLHTVTRGKAFDVISVDQARRVVVVAPQISGIS